MRVLHPGRLNGGAGPDFRDAVLELAGEQRRGDVELHVRASSFRAHGHHLDPAYDGVALHVVYLDDDGPRTLLKGGGEAPVAAFAPWLQRRTADLQRWLESPALWREPCRDAPGRLTDAAIADALAAAGRERLRRRAQRLGEAIAMLGREEALWHALLDCLGAGGDRDGFRRLAERFPASLARSLALGLEGAAELEAALLAVSGLGQPARTRLPALPPTLAPGLSATGRPLNHPARRLAGLARLYVRADAELAAWSLASVRNVDPRAALQAWSVAGATAGGPALIGRERAQELLLNLALPLAALDPQRVAAAEALALALRPAAPYGKTAFLEVNLRRMDGKRRITNALEQQGLLGLLTDWCSQGGCGRCPLS